MRKLMVFAAAFLALGAVIGAIVWTDGDDKNVRAPQVSPPSKLLGYSDPESVAVQEAQNRRYRCGTVFAHPFCNDMNEVIKTPLIAEWFTPRQRMMMGMPYFIADSRGKVMFNSVWFNKKGRVNLPR